MNPGRALSSFWRRALAVAARAPFTTVLELTILGIASTNGSAMGILSTAIRREWGFDPIHFWQGHWHSLATGALLVRNAPMLAGILGFLTVSVGVCEWRLGTRRAILLLLLAHVSTLLLMAALAYGLRSTGVPLPPSWVPDGDVGASFGGFGCLGGWVRGVHPPARLRWLALITVALAAKLVIFPEWFGDVGHLVAFYAGMLLDRLLPAPHAR